MAKNTKSNIKILKRKYFPPKTAYVRKEVNEEMDQQEPRHANECAEELLDNPRMFVNAVKQLKRETASGPMADSIDFLRYVCVKNKK